MTAGEERTAICEYLGTKEGQILDEDLINAISDRAHHAWGRAARPGPNPRRRKKGMAWGEDASAWAAAQTLREFLDVVQRFYLAHKLKQYGGDVTRTAVELDVDRRTLMSLLVRLGVKEVRKIKRPAKREARG